MKTQGSYESHFKKAKAARAPLTEEEIEAQLRKTFGMKMPDSRPKSSLRKKKTQRSKNSYFPLYPIISLMAMLIGLSSYMIFPQPFERLFSRIEISFMGQAEAQADRKKAPSVKSEEKAKPSSAKGQGEGSKTSEAKSSVSEDMSYLSKLRERKAALDLREAELNQLEEELQRQKVEVEKRITELIQIREEIKAKLEDRVEADEQKVKKLVELYSSMKPKQAAKVIENINTELAVEVLANMKKKSAADIMNVMDEKVAKELSERLTGYGKPERVPANAN